MTKVRDPATWANAVTKIAGLITFAGAAEAVGKTERAVRFWSDASVGTVPTLEDALLLDEAYLRAGGGCAPMLEAYELMLGLARAEAEAEALANLAAQIALDGAEAVAAVIHAARPGATPNCRRVARREVLEAAETLTGVARKLEEDEA